ncbi:alpha/beta fold hydrolase [Kibdelosporangium persicum]|uniref:Pimeloyl-ACP methyl ester carboxylesterase n=1 Tax=Kibdelosporangium persicum TaxID=2698649 RepID=A0ABX2FBL8_9PSEU|nr:alpha/beta hydrolase [Kibdelosporangium persicum]NRN68779.1 Pimeloyl-ACP methyl ester carboxylesterase [Kibdelosporangium persicum]
MSPYEARWDDVGGRKVRSLTASNGDGTAPPVVLVPGLGALGYLIDTMLGCSVSGPAFLVDVPGFGHRRPRPCPPELPDIAALTVDWLRAVARRPVVLFGHSTGAQVALHVARSAPESVRSVVLAGPTFPPALREPKALLRAFMRNSRYEPQGLIPITWPYYLRGGPVALTRFVRSAQQDRPEEVIKSIGCPVTVIRGRHDAFSPAEWCRDLAGERVITAPGAHTFPFRRGGLTAALVASSRDGT